MTDRQARLMAALWLGLVTFAITTIPTALIPNPLFTRMIPAEWWNWPVAILSTALVVVLVALPKPTACRPPTRVGILGGGLAYLAVGCPTCNHLVVLAIGTTGALNWFAPLQPIMALVGLLVLAAAIAHRVRLLRVAVA